MTQSFGWQTLHRVGVGERTVKVSEETYGCDSVFGWRTLHRVGFSASSLSVGEDGRVDAAQNIADDWLSGNAVN